MLQPVRPDVFNFRFSADRTFKDKFERLAEVLGVEGAQKHMAEILEKALDIALEKKDRPSDRPLSALCAFSKPRRTISPGALPRT